MCRVLNVRESGHKWHNGVFSQQMNLTGRTLDDNYLILRQLGVGGMGSVYLARDTRLARDVAIKVLLPDRTADVDYNKRFRREARLLAKLESPNVVRFFAWSIWQQQYPYIVMELLTGESLSQRLAKSGRLSWREAFRIAIQVCSGLEALHNVGIIHRDLSPSNIFLCDGQDELVKIIDLGLANRPEDNTTGNRTASGLLIGSVHYMSPEMCGGGQAGKQSDIYALGCILYELISGEKAIQGDHPMGVVYKHANEYPVELKQLDPTIPDVVQAIIAKSIRKKLNQRYESTATLRQDMINALNGNTVAIKSTWNNESDSESESHRTRVALVALPAAVLIAMSALSISHFTHHRADSIKPPSPQENKSAFFSPKSAEILKYVETSVEKGSPGPKVLENQINQWLKFDARRSENDNLLYVAAVYERLGNAYYMIGDAANEERIWQLHDLAVSNYKPTGDAQQHIKTNRRIISYRRRALYATDDEVADQNIKAFFEAARGPLPAKSRAQTFTAISAREAKIACKKREWDRALRAADRCVDNSVYLTRFNVLDLCRLMALNVPDSLSKEKIAILKRFSHNLQHVHFLDEAVAHGDDMSNTMLLVEVGATNEQLDMAHEWLNLYFKWFKLRNPMLEDVLQEYSKLPLRQPFGPTCKRLIRVVDYIDQHNDDQRQLYPSRCLDEEALRLCALYPAKAFQRGIKIGSDDLQNIALLFTAVKRAEPVETLQTTRKAFTALAGFDTIVENFFLDYTAHLQANHGEKLLPQLASDPRFSNIRPNLLRCINKAKNI